MSVVIENMEMPKDCVHCRFNNASGQRTTLCDLVGCGWIKIKENHRADECPLVETQPESKWIPCSERLPEETVLVTVETKTFRHRYICEAVWIPRWTWKASFDNWEDCSEYNEDDDEFYVNEGWYERVHNWDEYSYVGIEDTVLAWMPLPELYQEEGE